MRDRGTDLADDNQAAPRLGCASGEFQGKTPMSGRGRPGLRVATWRAVWAALTADSRMNAS